MLQHLYPLLVRTTLLDQSLLSLKYVCTLILHHKSFSECLDAKQNRNKEIRHEVSGTHQHQAFRIQDVEL